MNFSLPIVRTAALTVAPIIFGLMLVDCSLYQIGKSPENTLPSELSPSDTAAEFSDSAGIDSAGTLSTAAPAKPTLDSMQFFADSAVLSRDTSDAGFGADSIADDTIPGITPVPDSLVLDSLKMDSLSGDSARKKESEIDTIITYKADSIFFDLDKRTTILYKNAQVNYQNMTLKAGRIVVDWEKNLLTAESIRDTIYIDTVMVKFDTLEIKEYKKKKAGAANTAADNLSKAVMGKAVMPDSGITGSTSGEVFSSGTPRMVSTGLEMDSTSAKPLKTTISKSDTFETVIVDLETGEYKQITVRIDSTRISGVDTIMTVGYPEFIQGADVLYGLRMKYNLKTKKGFVEQGKTEYGDGYYKGKDVKRVGEKVLNVGSGYFTTCENDTPHYKFYSKEMKLIVKDKVVARPVVMYFGEVPVGILPFAVFSTKAGRRSGMIIPYYGESAGQGRFFKNLGYYWAPSGYWDIRGTMSYFDRYDNVLFDSQAYYKVRYRLNGWVAGSYYREENSKRWDLRFNHSHTPTPTSSLNINGTFTSDAEYYKDLSSNPVDRMNRILHSNATFNDKLKYIDGRYSVNLSYDENLDTKATTLMLPRFSANMGQKTIFPMKEDQEEPNWFNKFYFSARTSYTNRHKKDPKYTTVTITEIDTSYTTTDTSFTTTKEAVMKNGYTLNTSQSLLKYINLNPSLSISQDLTDERRDYYYDSASDSVQWEKENGIFARHTFSFNLGLSTKLYGLFPANFWHIEAFRHVFEPSVSFRYTPDFSREFYGYYQYLETDSGGIIKKDRFSNQPLLGGTPASRARSMSFTLNNIFQMKRVLPPKDEKEEEEVVKTDLFSLNISTSYNFEAISMGWSSVSSSFRANPIQSKQLGPIKKMTIDLSTIHSPYATNANGYTIDQFYFEDDNWKEGKLLRLTNLNFKSSFSLVPIKLKKKTKKEGFKFSESDTGTVAVEDTTEYDAYDFKPTMDYDRFGYDMNFRPQDIPWSWELIFRFNWSQNNPTAPANKTYWIENNINLPLTNKWTIGYTHRINLVTGVTDVSSFSFYRDMHCWEGRFYWNPIGVNKSFFIKINVKSPSLQDLKVEKRRGQGGFLNY